MTNSRVLLNAVLNETTPVFLASRDARDSKLTVHVAAGCNIASLKARIRDALPLVSGKLSVSVRAHNSGQLAFPRSLEHWLGGFSSDFVIYDPTMILGRARSLVTAAKACRSKFGEQIKGMFFDPGSRKILVLVRSLDQINAADLQTHLKKAIAEVHSATSVDPEMGTGWLGSLQIVSDLPHQKLVPIDARSATFFGKVVRFIRRWRNPGLLAVAISAAAGLPAAASTDAGQQFAQPPVQVISTNKVVPAHDEYGLLSALAVFTDGQRPDVSDPFVSTGLRTYFGNMKLAQTETRRRRREPTEIGQVGGGGGAGPGS